MGKFKILVISDYRDTLSVRPEAELFIRLSKTGVHVDIITYPEAAYIEQFEKHRIRVLPNHPKRKFDRHFIRFLRNLLKEEKYLILHLFNSSAITNGIISAYGMPVKVVLYRGYTGNVAWYDPASYFKYLNPRVDKIWCIASAIEELLRRQLFFNKNKPVTIAKGHDPEWFSGVGPADLSQFGISNDAFVVACVANARPFKGIRFLLQSTWFLPSGKNIHILLIGRGMDDQSLVKLVAGSPLKDQIHITGYRTDVLDILSASNVFVLPSIKGEATTKSVIEAMSLSITPVITDIPGNRELVSHGKTGLVVPVKNPQAIAEAIIALFENQERCASLGKAARNHIIENFNIKDTVRKIRSLYESLV